MNTQPWLCGGNSLSFYYNLVSFLIIFIYLSPSVFSSWNYTIFNITKKHWYSKNLKSHDHEQALDSLLDKKPDNSMFSKLASSVLKLRASGMFFSRNHWLIRRLILECSSGGISFINNIIYSIIRDSKKFLVSFHNILLHEIN